MNDNYDLSGDLAKRLLNAAPDPTVIVDRSGVIVFANTRIEQTFGYDHDELIGQSVETLLPERFRESHPRHRQQFSESAQPRPMGAGLDLYGRHKDGHEFPVEVSLSPLQTAGGLLISSAIRDVTEQRRIERALADADRAKSRFLAAASHDLRQPLQALMLLNRAATRSCAHDGELPEILDRQQKALESMSALLNSLLDVSKLDSGGIEPQPANIALQQIFDQLQSNFVEQAHEKDLTLRIAETDLAVCTDAQLLQQLLANLLSNAIRYTSAGEVSIHAAAEDWQNVTVIVEDTGIGIPENEIDLVFSEFYQVERQSVRQEGLGLGLSIVKRIAALLDVPLSIDSKEGRGTRFILQLRRAAQAEPAGVRAIAHRPSDGARILIVDDDRAVADATRLLLEIEGFEVQVATNEAEAMQAVVSVNPDLIISDFHLRCGSNGATVVRNLRAALSSATPVIFVSGDTTGLPRNDSLRQAQYLIKPLNGDELLRAIHSGLATEPDRSGAHPVSTD